MKQANYSGPVVSCSRCHDPHGWKVDYGSRYVGNPKLLKLGPDSEVTMCNDCHVDWASDTAASENGGTVPTNVHPMVSNYAAIAAAKVDSYKSVGEMELANGEVALNATGGIDCMSCHGVHWTDSDASTLDGPGQALNPGDGKILKAGGAALDQPGVAGVSLCQSCHKYQDHGLNRSAGANAIGCLVCHGAHLEDTGGSMNNYMLRAEITTYLPKNSANGTVSGLALNVATAQSTRLWNYCFNCHDSAAAVGGHNVSWNCAACHKHSAADGSWTAAGGCNTCHGFPPTQGAEFNDPAAPNGYAAGYAGTAHFKNEANTQHKVHASGIDAGDYSFNCNNCHAGNNHIDGSFDDVFLATSDQLYNGNGLLTGGSAPAYDSTGAGSCSSVYCHSNGGPRGATPTVSAPLAWEGGAAIATCAACHGNDVTTMGAGERNNSATHIAHLNKGYSCQVCHADTATSATALTADAIGGTHVDGTADVAWDGTSVSLDLSASSYGLGTGVCGVYCHSNGKGAYAAPDWDLAATGECGSCHQYSNAGVAAGSGAALGGAHDAHVFDANGPRLACDACHTHNGAPGQANGDHVNGGLIDLKADACNACHGSEVDGVGNDAEPIWATPGSVTCQTCHAGTVIATIGGNGGSGTYVDKRAYVGYGHGKSANFETTYGAVTSSCEGCHDATAAGHFNGNDNPRLKVLNGKSYADDNNVWCQDCHATMMPHFSSTGASTTATACATCHNPHGQAGNTQDAMIVSSIGGKPVSGFAAQGVATSYFSDTANGSSEYEGICQVCHQAPVSHYTRTAAPDGHNDAANCVSCHSHTTTPAFKASCNACHGNANGQYWPYGSGGNILSANDEVGEHAVHVLAIGQELGYGDYSVTMYSDAQQKEICSYCHAVNDDDHAQESTAEALDATVGSVLTPVARFIGNGSTDSAATYVAGTCNNVACHNGKSTDTVDGTFNWKTGVDNPGCILCHDNITNTGIATGQTHAAHTGASALYGISIGCDSCHDAATDWAGKVKPGSNHINGTFNLGGTVSFTYSGGSCGTNACHEDGKGGAPPAYTWGTAGASDCGICHSAAPNTGAHAVHLSDTNGPNLGADCAACHKAISSSSMAGMTTHIKGTVTLKTSGNAAYAVIGSVGQVDNDAVDTCNSCHGGASAALIAKDNWAASTPVSCGSCHGDNDPVTIGVTAPVRAGNPYTSWGHGRTAGADSYKPNQGCTACHDENSAHFNNALGENRLKVSPNNSKDYSVAEQRNDYCNDCHTTAGAMNVHFGNDNTPLGTSTDGLYCVTCHDPHGQGSLDAMVKATIDTGVTVTGFTDRENRDHYRNDGFTGVCQTCHDSTEVAYFDQDTEDANATHNPGANCIACHPHQAEPAFKASCNACHGDVNGQYWPDGDDQTQMNAANDDAGRHEVHVVLISQKLGYGDKTALLAHADTDSRQKAICAYCHAVNDDDHAQSLPAEVFKATVGGTANTVVAKRLWDGLDDGDAAFTKATGTCATVDCHNNKTTTTVDPYNYSWSGANTSNCVMCHVDVTDTGIPSHTLHTRATWGIACSACHAGSPAWGDTANTATQTEPSTGHMNGTYSIGGGSRSFIYSGGSCGVNECHNNGNMGDAVVPGYDWATGSTEGFCGACHGFPVATNSHLVHLKAHETVGVSGTERFKSTSIFCTDCHTHAAATDAHHINGTINFKAGISYSASALINDGGAFGSCTTLICHSDGRGNTAETPLWTRAQTAADDCTLCHGDGSGGNISNSHAVHTGTNGATTYVSGTGNQSTAAEYRFDCGLCHGTTIANHLNGSKNLEAGVAWNGTTCGTNDCHQNGRGGAPAVPPNWVDGFAPGADPCAQCHLNSPDTNAHHEHEVGFHYDAVYSGLTGFLPVKDNDSYDAGLDASNFDQLRGHGGNLTAGGFSTSTTITCYVCHYETVNTWSNANNTTCATCHTAVANPAAGDMAVGNAALTIADKSKHVQPGAVAPVQVVFFPQKVRSKAQLRDDLADVTEISSNWTRINGYKANNGSSYDEQPDTLNNLSTWNSVDKTCTTSCHLWEAGRVDKVPVDWEGGHIMCIDCHTRLPK